MKQILLLFLLLPCFAMAQYTGNANQKITLGEQTTADGLVYRGVQNDTALITPLSDTSAYIILDTVNNKFYNYNRTTNVWSLAGGGVSVSSFSAGTTGLTPNTATTGAVTLGGTLAVANGGTNTSTLTANKVIVGNGTSGVITPTNLHWDNTNSRMGINKSDPIFNLDINGTIRMFHSTANAYSAIFYNTNVNGEGLTSRGGSASNHNSLLIQTYDGNINLFQIAGNGAATFSSLAGLGDRAVEADVNGVLSAPVSSITTKENVQSLDYGLNQILQINPVSFNYIDKYKWGEGRKLGFIVEDMFSVVPEVTGTMNNGNLYLDMVKLIPILTKAIQEQQALIKALEQRLLILENK